MALQVRLQKSVSRCKKGKRQQRNVWRNQEKIVLRSLFPKQKGYLIFLLIIMTQLPVKNSSVTAPPYSSSLPAYALHASNASLWTKMMSVTMAKPPRRFSAKDNFGNPLSAAPIALRRENYARNCLSSEILAHVKVFQVGNHGRETSTSLFVRGGAQRTLWA